MAIFSAQRGIEKKIQKLKPELARKIAAGEVIDRPHAVVRELLDNAIDSGANNIRLEIFSGGIEKIIVKDNGIGLSKEDLALCAQPHATSKIGSELDLLKIQSMGFRGEALSSIAAVSRLKIQSKQKQTKENHAWCLESEVGLEDRIEPCLIHEGSIVEAQGLFANFPARRQFLKRPATEAALCRQVFIEKSLPFIDIHFSFFSDGEKKLDFPEAQSYKERFASALGLEKSLALLHELEGQDTAELPEWRFKLVIGDPSLARTDRKQIHIFTNNRKIDEYSFVQAIEYGCQGYFPNGLKPIAALFLEISPALVDFNIHPAKKEARFKDSTTIHRAIHTSINRFFRSFSFKAIQEDSLEREETKHQYEFSNDFSIPTRDQHFSKPAYRGKESHFSPSFLGPRPSKDFEEENRSSYAQASQPIKRSHIDSSFQNEQEFNRSATKKNGLEEKAAASFRYFGSYASLFLIAEKNEKLYIIDQHAAHERILFNQFMQKKAQSQNLLIPQLFTTKDKNEDSYLESIQNELGEQGFQIEKVAEGKWEIREIHELWEGDLEGLFSEILKNKTEPRDLLRKIAENYACKKAIKDGSYLDDASAIALITESFSLDDPHCPHGRPIWTIISKEELFSRVKRS